VSALARGARKSHKRFAGALDAMHGVRVTLDERPGSELATSVAEGRLYG
jgi:recombinational DNA repair protein (RecF pathway)